MVIIGHLLLGTHASHECPLEWNKDAQQLERDQAKGNAP